jgi:Domain of unknown function (DUF4936)
MSDAPRSVFVYYRVAPEHAEATREGVQRLFRTLMASFPGLQARVMCKAPDPGRAGEATWMEVYEHPQGVPADLLAHMDEQARTLLSHQTGLRHVEVFTPMPGFESGGLG